MRRRRYSYIRRRKSEEQLPLSFYIGLLAGFSFGVPSGVYIVQHSLQLLEVLKQMLGIAGVVGFTSFAMRVYYYLERGWIIAAMRYTRDKVIDTFMGTALDSMASAIGYLVGTLLASAIMQITMVLNP